MLRVVALVAGLLVPGLPLLGMPLAASEPGLYAIAFPSGEIDPAAAFPAIEPAGHDLVLVQFERVGLRGVVEDVVTTGARLVQPIAPVSYIVWADGAQTRAIRRLRDVRWAGVLPAQARVADTISERTTRLRVTTVSGGGRGGWRRAFTHLDGTVFELDGGRARALALAKRPEVYAVTDAGGPAQVRDERSAQVVAAGTATPVVPGYGEFLERIGADGSGVVVSHVDTGVDANHPDLAGRLAACVGYGPLGPTACGAGNHDIAGGHGTHTLGIILGTGASSFSDVDGFRYGQGVAPGATAVAQNAIGFTSGNPFVNGYRALYRHAHDLGAIVSGNSWGPSGSPKGYDANTREFDSIVRDIDDEEAGDQPLALVFSIMNGRGGTSTQGTPDEGKNILAIGASGSRASATQGLSGGGVTEDDLCYCTAHGPALDGRLLPTLVAPGENVVSTRGSAGWQCQAAGTSARELPPSPLHAPCTGTSMASPHVTGGYAVFVDWYRDHHGGATPSPALVKAAFVNGADDLAGGKDADGRRLVPIPNNQQGWGRFNLGNVIAAWDEGVVHVDQSVVLGASGESSTVTVEPLDRAKPLKVTLAWTDALGPGLGGRSPAWVNDLDLRVEGIDARGTVTTWLGNVFDDGRSVTGGRRDRKNNVENVYLPTPQHSAYRVTVDALNILGDGLPNTGDPTDQDFALVVTNARLVTP